MPQLQLITVPVRPALEVLAKGTLRRRRQACIDRWGRGVRMVDHPRRLHLELYRGRTLIARALRPAQDAQPPGALDKVGWVLRSARAWHTLAMAPEKGKAVRLSFEDLEGKLAAQLREEEAYSPRYPRRAKQLRLVGGA